MSEPYLVVRTETNYGKPFKEVLIDLCEQHGTVTDAARMLEMSRNTLWILMSRYDLSWQDIRFEVLKRKANALGVSS